jgi:hypothetical protein
MAWTNSKIFRQTIADMFGNVAAFDLDADTIKCALFDNDITPDQDVSAANSAYNAGQWTASGNEVSDGAEWAAGGVALASKTVTTGAGGLITFDAADTASGTSATLPNVYGCHHYDDTLTTPVADQGICFNYFGGAQSVTDGQFTVVYHATLGIMQIDV